MDANLSLTGIWSSQFNGRTARFLWTWRKQTDRAATNIASLSSSSFSLNATVMSDLPQVACDSRCRLAFGRPNRRFFFLANLISQFTNSMA
jgi:hypothetical protein